MKIPVVVPTLDIYKGKAVLVTSGSVTSVIGDPKEVAEKLNILPIFLVTDLTSAIHGSDEDLELVLFLAKKYACYVAGGIRTLDKAKKILDSSARRVYIGSTPDLLSELPKDRTVLAIDVDDSGNILTYGRSVTEKETVQERISKWNPERVAITFHGTEGTSHEPDLKFVMNLQTSFPNTVFLMAGGRWGEGLVKQVIDHGIYPQIGNSFYRNEISLGDAIVASLSGDLYPTVVQNTDGLILGICSSSKESIAQCARTRSLWLYSETRKELWFKGATSGDTFEVVQIDVSCMGKSVRIVVRGNKFCHENSVTCFHARDPGRASIRDLQTDIKKSVSSGGYSTMLQDNPSYLTHKMLEETDELISASIRGSKTEIVGESADVLYHLVSLLTSKGVDVEDVINELNARRYKVGKAPHFTFPRPQGTVIGVCNGRQKDRARKFSERLGIDQGDAVVIDIKPKDASRSLSYGIIDLLIGYSDVVQLLPDEDLYEIARDASSPVRISICVKQDSEVTHVSQLNGNLVLTEYREITERYFVKHGVSPKLRCFYGSTEEMISKDIGTACVVLIETGSTLQKYGLRELEMIEELNLCLYGRKSFLLPNSKSFSEVEEIEGVDGAGKTTLVKLLKTQGMVPNDRGVMSKLTDTPHSKLPATIPKTIVVLADSSLCYQRKKDVPDKYHTREAIDYYTSKYWELACMYHCPLVLTDNFRFNTFVEFPPVEDPAFVFEDLPLIAKGCSKEVRQYGNFDVIRYIPSVYSHTLQRDGMVEGTDIQRMRTTRTFLEILRREGVPHNYIYVGTKYIVAHHLESTGNASSVNDIEVIVKKYYLGNDKHRYYELNTKKTRYPIMKKSTEFNGEYEYLDPYVRFDIRNPNFTREGKPLGDYALSDSLADAFIDTAAARALALRAFDALSKHMKEFGVILKDICFMITTDGKKLWGEISSDNMRCGTSLESLDKDVWRSGGSSELVLKKWTKLAELSEDYVSSLPHFVV